MPSAPLRVLPNPYSALDQFGHPSGAARLDPDKRISAGQRRYIGARLEADIFETRVDGAGRPDGSGLAPTLQRNRWSFTTDKPIEIADTPYHRGLLRAGSILPWDEGTHRVIFGLGVPFRAPAEALRAAREAAIKIWIQEHPRGEEPAFTRDAASTPA